LGCLQKLLFSTKSFLRLCSFTSVIILFHNSSQQGHSKFLLHKFTIPVPTSLYWLYFISLHQPLFLPCHYFFHLTLMTPSFLIFRAFKILNLFLLFRFFLLPFPYKWYSFVLSLISFWPLSHQENFCGLHNYYSTDDTTYFSLKMLSILINVSLKKKFY
jgi:hypothetical protein